MKNNNSPLRTLLFGALVILFSKPIGMCFHIVGDVILNGGEFLKSFMF